MTHPVRAAWALGSHPGISQAEEQYFPFIAQAVSDITTRDLDRVRCIVLVSGGSVKFYEYDPENTDAEDGVNVILDSDDRPFVLRTGIGLGQRKSVRVATTANITIATALNNGDTLDGVTLATSDLVLVKDQSSAAENGIYVVGTTPARHSDFDAYDDHAGAMIAVEEGTANEGTLWFCSANAGGTLGTTAIEFTNILVTSDIPGPPGSAGADGSDPGILLTFDADTADSDQGSGKVWFDNATLTSATVMYVSKTNRAGSDIAAKLARFDDSSNPSPKAEGSLTRTSDDVQLTFAMGAVTDATGYVKIAISDVAGPSSFTAADALSLQVERVGDAGSGLANIVEDTTPQLGGTLDTNAKQIRWSKGADVASANALTLGDDGNYFDITGTTAITSIGTKAPGTVVKLHFDAALTLTHHATDLILPGGANITTAAGDEAEFVEYATGDWRCTSYTKASGYPVAVTPGSTTVVGGFEKATVAEVAAATTDKAITADLIESGSALVALTDAATVAVDWDAGIAFSLTVTANRAIGNPTNGQPGTFRVITVQGNDATDRTITFGTNYEGDIPTITDCDSTTWYDLYIRCITSSHFTVTAHKSNKP